jgi:DNA-binding NtrC family response regulator
VKLVLIDDNADFAESMRAVLQILRHDARCYFNGHDFLRRIGQLGDIDLLITDYYLPDLNGIEVVKRARVERPGLKAILLTGSRENGIVKAAEGLGGCRIEFKPIDWKSLERSIRQLNDAPPLAAAARLAGRLRRDAENPSGA